MARIFRRYQSTIYGNYRKSALIAGALTGAGMAVVTFLFDQLSKTPMAQPENYITELVLAIGILWTSYQYRKDLPEEKVTLKELMLLGLGIGLFSGIVYGLWVWLNCGVINPSMGEYYIKERLAAMPPATESADAKLAIETLMKYTAGDWGFIAGFRSFVMSIIIAFIASLIFRTEKSPVVVKQPKGQNADATNNESKK